MGRILTPEEEAALNTPAPEPEDNERPGVVSRSRRPMPQALVDVYLNQVKEADREYQSSFRKYRKARRIRLEKILHAHEVGCSMQQIAEALNITKSSVQGYVADAKVMRGAAD